MHAILLYCYRRALELVHTLKNDAAVGEYTEMAAKMTAAGRSAFYDEQRRVSSADLHDRYLGRRRRGSFWQKLRRARQRRWLCEMLYRIRIACGPERLTYITTLLALYWHAPRSNSRQTDRGLLGSDG